MTQWPGHRKLSCVIISSHHTVLASDLVTINQGERKLIFALSTFRAALCFPNDSLDKLSQLKSIIHIFALSTVIMSNVIVPAAHLETLPSLEVKMDINRDLRNVSKYWVSFAGNLALWLTAV